MKIRVEKYQKGFLAYFYGDDTDEFAAQSKCFGDSPEEAIGFLIVNWSKTTSNCQVDPVEFDEETQKFRCDRVALKYSEGASTSHFYRSRL